MPAALVKAPGIKGVGQLLAYCEDIEKVSDLRGPATFGVGATLKADRTRCQLILEPYDRPLTMAPTSRALLVAFRDAVQGYRNLLFDRHILHRDISVHNIMFHGTGSEGNTGRVADLDLAADTGKLWREGERTEGDVRTGTHAYQSYKILSQADESLPLGPHDHMDDLESFFYVLCHISAMVKGPKTREIPDLAGHPELRKWVLSSDETPDFKLKVIHERILYVRCTEYFARYKDLLDKLRYFFWPRIAIAQDAVVDSKPMPNLEWPLEERLERAKADYDGFTEIVSEFIELLGPDATDSDQASAAGATVSVATTADGENKRPRSSSESDVAIRDRHNPLKKTKG